MKEHAPSSCRFSRRLQRKVLPGRLSYIAAYADEFPMNLPNVRAARHYANNLQKPTDHSGELYSVNFVLDAC